MCVYPELVAPARAAVADSGVRVASVATGFPAGQTPLELRLAEVREAVATGADEIDMVISRRAYLPVTTLASSTRSSRSRTPAAASHLKVILETAELGSDDHVRHASMLAMDAGADFIKTSTGKSSAGATPGVVLVMLEAIRDYVDRTGRVVGMKPAGGVSTSKQALHQLVLVARRLAPRG